MLNPFLEPGSLRVEQEKRRRHRFKLGMYAAFATLMIFLLGLLIQGCRQGSTLQ